MTINVSPDLTLRFVLPTLVELAISGVAWWILFRVSLRRQSRGLFLVSLGFFAMTIIDGSWQVFYWLILGGPYEFSVFYQTGVSLEQFALIASLTGWIATAVYSGSFVLMILFVTYGALRIVGEKGVTTETPA